MLPIVSYPPFSLEAFTEASRIVRSRSFVSEKSLFGLCEFNIQGWLMGVAFGQPTFGAEPTDQECQRVQDLQNALSEYQAADDHIAASGDEGLDLVTVAVMVEVMLKLIAMFWKKRNER